MTAHLRQANIQVYSIKYVRYKAGTTADPESSKSVIGDLQHLREMTLRSA